MGNTQYTLIIKITYQLKSLTERTSQTPSTLQVGSDKYNYTVNVIRAYRYVRNISHMHMTKSPFAGRQMHFSVKT